MRQLLFAATRSAPRYHVQHLQMWTFLPEPGMQPSMNVKQS